MANGAGNVIPGDTFRQLMMTGWRILLLVFMGISAWGINQIVDVQDQIGDLRTEIAKEYATRAEVQCLTNKVENGFSTLHSRITDSFQKLGDQVRDLRRDLYLETLKDKRQIETEIHKKER